MSMNLESVRMVVNTIRVGNNAVYAIPFGECRRDRMLPEGTTERKEFVVSEEENFCCYSSLSGVLLHRVGEEMKRALFL